MPCLPTRRRGLALAALLAAAVALAALPTAEGQKPGRAKNLFNRMKQQQQPADEAEPGIVIEEAQEPVVSEVPEATEQHGVGGFRFERRQLAVDEMPGFSVYDDDLQMIKWVLSCFRLRAFCLSVRVAVSNRSVVD